MPKYKQNIMQQFGLQQPSPQPTTTPINTPDPNESEPEVFEIELADLTEFPNHPFRVVEDEEMEQLVESVKAIGIVSPVLVRPRSDGGYDVISGHRRKRAAELAGLTTLPCIVRDLTDEEAVISMVDSNLQREKILPSEKAYAYKMKLDAMRRQGKRTDLTSDPVGWKLAGKESAEIVGKDTGDSQTQVRRFIRLTHLIPELLSMVDNDQMPMRTAVELSYLLSMEQEWLLKVMEQEAVIPSYVQAQKLRDYSEKRELNETVVQLTLRKPESAPKKTFKLRRDRIEKFFSPAASQEEMENTIVEALELYQEFQGEKQTSQS